MIIDASAIVAIALNEDTAPALLARIAAEPVCEMPVAGYVEAGMVLALRGISIDAFEALLRGLSVQLVAMDESQAREALRARIRFGKGFKHPAQLNFGDSFPYALAKLRGEPLLFVGEDFSHTDIEPALT